jgi:hypothetical protein
VPVAGGNRRTAAGRFQNFRFFTKPLCGHCVGNQVALRTTWRIQFNGVGCEPFHLNPQPVEACPMSRSDALSRQVRPVAALRLPDCTKELVLSDSVLARLVATVIVLISVVLWLRSERNQSPACHPNCSTDFSAVRR